MKSFTKIAPKSIELDVNQQHGHVFSDCVKLHQKLLNLISLNSLFCWYGLTFKVIMVMIICWSVAHGSCNLVFVIQ
jgi:hypothetical protein